MLLPAFSRFKYKFWEVLASITASGRDDLFFAPRLILQGKRTSADVMTFKEPVVLHSENMVTISYTITSFCCYTEFMLKNNGE